MDDLARRALDTATHLGASYADVRIVRRREQSAEVKGGRVEGLSLGESEGYGIRVLVDGAWGFASSSRMDAAQVDATAALAVRIARASARHARHPIVLSERPPAVGHYRSPVEEDPFTVPIDQTVATLLAAERAAAAVLGVTISKAEYHAFREWRAYSATDGSATEQVITHVGAGLEVQAASDDDLQRRSYPESGGYRAAGYEHIRALDLVARAGPLAEEAVELLSAPVLPPGRRTVVLHPSQLYLQVHESCGHPTELDRVFGTEAAYAGTSFLTTDKLEAGFRYGSDLITIVADATTPGGLGTFGWDDEGVEAQRVALVDEGIFSGYLSSRETAPRIGRASSGAVRADGWNRLPLIRMTNINLEPRPGMSLDDIIADTDDGLLFESNRSWSIDDRRLNFQFGVEVAREIRGGRLGQLYRNATYTGITPEFWGSCDAVADERSWVLVGVTNCGKGQPGQSMHVGHGSSGARFRDVEVGVGERMSTAVRDGLEIADRAVAMALEAGATQAEALVMRSSTALTRFANNEIHQNVAEEDTTVNLRFVDGQRVGVASANRHADADLARLAQAAAETARLQPAQSDFVSLPSARPTPLVAGAFAAATAEADPEVRADAAAAVIAAAEAAGVQAFGYAQTSDDEVSVVNSLGIRVSEPRTRAQVLTVMMGPAGGTGYAEQVAVDLTAIEASSIGREAAERTSAMRDPIELPAGDYAVVLDSYAVVDFVDWLGYLGFSALAVQEERSFYEPGRVVASPLIDLSDDAADPGGTPASFDYEGVPTERVQLIAAGACHDVVYDTQTAARAHRLSTGHGLPAPNSWGPFPLHLSMAPGSTPRDELIGGLERGLLVTRFHYTNVVHPKQVVITGMTRDGLFLVEGGRITAPVRNLRFTQNYLDALASVEAVSEERKALEGFLGTALVPALRLGSFTFTGTTEH